MGSDQKPGQIDRELLTTHHACSEAVKWFDATWPGGVTSYDEGLDALQRGHHLDYIAWALLKVPGLRERAPAELRREVLGPRHAELIALADDTARSGWLTPRGAAGAEDLDALADLVGEHHERLAALTNGATPGYHDWSVVPLEAAWSEVAPVLGLSWDERHGHGPPPTTWALAWRNAWRAAGSGGEEAACAAVTQLLPTGSSLAAQAPSSLLAAGALDVEASPWFEQRLWLIADVSAQLRPIERVAKQVCRTLDDAAFVRCYRCAKERFLAAREGATWRAAARAMVRVGGKQSPTEDAAVHATATLAATARLDLGAAALWLLADVAEPNPWEPLLAIWRLGYWPAGAINGTFIVGKPASR